MPCPFRGPMTFSYNRGHGTCSVPVSNVDTCTDDSRLLFRYQACPDISASESAGKLSVIIQYCILVYSGRFNRFNRFSILFEHDKINHPTNFSIITNTIYV